MKNQILKAISKVKDSNKFLPNEVFSNLAIILQIHLGSSSRVTSSLHSDLKEYVEKTGETKAKGTLKDGKKEVGRSEEYYRLLKELPKIKLFKKNKKCIIRSLSYFLLDKSARTIVLRSSANSTSGTLPSSNAF